MLKKLLVLSLVVVSTQANAKVGDEIEVSSAPVTAISCAKIAEETGKVDGLNSCSMAEAIHGYAVVDVAEKVAYQFAPKNIHTYEIEKAFGGGSIDFEGVIVGEKDGVQIVEVKEYTVNPKPKAGGFKGCL